MVITITDENRELFRGLASLDMLTQQPQTGRFCLGGIGEDEQGQCAAGVLCFTIMANPSGEVQARVEWLYVAEKFRRRMIASQLLEEMAVLLKKTGVETVRCDLPFSEEYNMTCAFLEKRGFYFHLMDKYEMTIPLAKVEQLPVFHKAVRQDKICSIRELSESAFRMGLLEVLLEREKKGQERVADYVAREGGIRMDNYEQSISCAVVGQNGPCAFFLIRQYPSDMLELVLLAGSSSVTGLDIFALLQYALEKAQISCPPETAIHIQCRSKATAELMDYLFPLQHPELVWRGYCETKRLFLMNDERRN